MLQNKPQKTKKTDIVRKSNNPTFHESFTFKLPVNSLDTASIAITAMQSLTTSKGKLILDVIFNMVYNYTQDVVKLQREIHGLCHCLNHKHIARGEPMVLTRFKHSVDVPAELTRHLLI